MASIRRIAEWTVPQGAAAMWSYASRFRRLGLPAWWCLDTAKKRALGMSRLELFPASVRENARVAIDIGANLGVWSMAVLEMTGVQRLLAFEPQPHVHAALTERLARFPQATCFGVALGDVEATLSMNMHPAHDFSSLLPLRGDVHALYGIAGAAPKRVEVPVRPLDAYTADLDRIDLLKVDVQGYESQVVRGAERTLARTECVLLEVLYRSHYEGDATFDGTHRLMVERGFSLYGISKPALSTTGEPLWADAVYLRRPN